MERRLCCFKSRFCELRQERSTILKSQLSWHVHSGPGYMYFHGASHSTIWQQVQMLKQHFSVLFLGTIVLIECWPVCMNYWRKLICTRVIQLIERRDKEPRRCNSVFDISACDEKLSLNFGFCFVDINDIHVANVLNYTIHDISALFFFIVNTSRKLIGN